MTPKEQVYRFISDQLILGNINPKDRITEQFLADKIGLSRTPIREALLLLSADSILEREPRKGYRIKVYSQKDVEQLYVVIGTLEGKTAELAVDYLGMDDYQLMKFLIDSMYSAIEHKLYTKYNSLQEQFHNVYISKCPNKFLTQELLAAKRIFIGKNCLRLKQDNVQEILKKTNHQHEKIEQLLEQGKSSELRRYLEVIHWSQSTAKYDVWQ
ncbi:GntR family transcriptional regulator [Liquorilactobacillus sicerae]|uniref:GntR family transcriptional regulator n=1 Tax=Liquorilactobacillus sicerae TaxID=1416943 RepID=UPI00248096AF|nr:GntR family transcriptional regulator [Liquorilactobacillus sicerae]